MASGACGTESDTRCDQGVTRVMSKTKTYLRVDGVLSASGGMLVSCRSGQQFSYTS